MPLHARTLDPKPVTLADAFTPSTSNTSFQFNSDFRYATLRSARDDANCAGAVWGVPLQRVLHNAGCSAGCSQILRAGYLSDNGQYIGLEALVNLNDEAAALRVADQFATRSAEGFLLPLTNPSPLSRLGEAYSMATPTAWGHYVQVTWVAREDGAEPSDPFTNLDDMTGVLSSPTPAFVRRLPNGPNPVVRIYVMRGQPSRCIVPAEVPEYSAVDFVLKGNERVSYQVLHTSVYGSVSLGSLGGLFTSDTTKGVLLIEHTGTYVIQITPAPRTPCVLVVH